MPVLGDASGWCAKVTLLDSNFLNDNKSKSSCNQWIGHFLQSINRSKQRLEWPELPGAIHLWLKLKKFHSFRHNHKIHLEIWRMRLVKPSSECWQTTSKTNLNFFPKLNSALPMWMWVFRILQSFKKTRKCFSNLLKFKLKKLLRYIGNTFSTFKCLYFVSDIPECPVNVNLSDIISTTLKSVPCCIKTLE